MTEPELIWRLAKAVRTDAGEVILQALLEYMGADALAADTWDEAWGAMQHYWLAGEDD